MPSKELECDNTGICCAFPTENDISFCINCGKELVRIEGQWLTWDYDFYPKYKPQN